MKIPKAVRVATGTVHLFTCPVCREEVTGTVEVEAHLGDLDLTLATVDNDTHTLRATMPVTTRARSLQVRHDCAPTQAEAGDPTLDVDDGDHRDRRLADEIPED
jgi:hypothetical protein